jgi:cupin fold WbuC family metalloprotein
MNPITAADLRALSAAAAATPRRRLNRNLHTDLADPVQRLLNAVTPGSYVRPHRHAADRWEVFAVLAGACAALEFADDGTVTARTVMEPGGTVLVEIPGGICHALAPLAEGTVLLEIKPGPYRPTTDKDFAAWAPAEGADGSADLARWMQTAAVGERWAPEDGECRPIS